jgi:NAD-dependent deacetylase
MDTIKLYKVIEQLREADQLLVLTGAGVSKESGVPTFRDAMEGLWANFNPQELATPEAFARNPRLVWDWYEMRRQKVAGVQPNPGHYAIAELEDLLPQIVVITQNVDGLHRAAGSSDVIELHGDIQQHRCFDNCQGEPTLVDVEGLTWDKQYGPPRCPHCGAYVRPNVVWFNEALPVEALNRALSLCRTVDVMLVVGTSGAVQPAASLPYYAKRWNDAFLVDINPQIDEIAPMCDVVLQGAAGTVLPELVRLLRQPS